MPERSNADETLLYLIIAMGICSISGVNANAVGGIVPQMIQKFTNDASRSSTRQRDREA